MDAIIYQKATSINDSTQVVWGIVTEPIEMEQDEVYQVSPDVTVITTGPATGLVVNPGKSDDP